MSTDTDTADRYSLGVTQHRGIMLNMGMFRLGVLAGGLLAIALSMKEHAWIAVGLFAIVTGVLIFGQSGGRRAPEWIPGLMHQAHGVATGRRRWVAGSPEPRVTSAYGDASVAQQPSGEFCDDDIVLPQIPPELGRLELMDDQGWPGGLGVAAWKMGGRRTLVGVLMTFGGDEFALSTGAAKSEAISGWRSVLDEMCVERPSVQRMTAVQRSLPCHSDSAARYLMDNAVTFDENTADYAATAERINCHANQQEVFIGVATAAGGSLQSQLETIRTEIGTLADRLSAAGIHSEAMSMRGLSKMLRTWADPFTVMGMREPANPERPGPLGRDRFWSRLHIDDCWHKSYYVSHWPATGELGPSWLRPLLAADVGDAVRTLAHHIEPVPPIRARRQQISQMMAMRYDSRQREKLGQIEGSLQERRYNDVDQREQELTAGYGLLKNVVVITLSAPSEESLKTAENQLAIVASQTGLTLQCCYGEQDYAWVASTPLCRMGFGGLI